MIEILTTCNECTKKVKDESRFELQFQLGEKDQDHSVIHFCSIDCLIEFMLEVQRENQQRNNE